MTTQLNAQNIALRCSEVVFETEAELEAAAIAWAGETLEDIFEDYDFDSEHDAINTLNNWDNDAERIVATVEDWNLYQRFYCVETETFGTVYLKEEEA